MPYSGMDMNSILTNEQCERRIQSILKELAFNMVRIESTLRDRRDNDESE